jgi:hypothetical protein
VATNESQRDEPRAGAARWVWPAAAVGLLAVVGLLVLFRAHNRFGGYVTSSSGAQEHVVREGWGIDLVFVDRQHAHTPYTVVYKHLDYPRAKIYRRRTSARNAPSVIHVQAGTSARIDVRWYVHGKSKARWTFTIRPRQGSIDSPSA